ncbi:MAG: type VI secretion system baseplate subunit TssG [Krumholzibacteria bacterium]|nr:type VI secretion system baseplate subunit TssG [Candidatus Krumholzibacteria bacterium]
MAAAGGRGPDRLSDGGPGAAAAARRESVAGVRAEGWRYSFFQAVRLLQLGAPDRVPVGTGDDPAREAVRFASRVSLAFAPSDVHDVREVDGRDELVVSFMGVATPASFGSLPMPYSELILGLDRDRQPALRAFLDLFNHRLVSLFYRAWEKCRFPMVYERTPAGGESLFERMLLALMGLGSSGLQGKLAVDDRALLARAHVVGARGIPALGLADLVQDYFGVPASVVQFVPAWYVFEENEVCRLGRQSCHLGQDACLGARARMAQSRFRVRLGPFAWPQMAGFLPNGDAHRALAELCTLAGKPQFDVEFQLQLAPGAAPPLRLGVADEQGVPWLGWSTWLRGEAAADTAEVIVDGEAVAAGPA